jgi:putative DNA primase/helicase
MTALPADFSAITPQDAILDIEEKLIGLQIKGAPGVLETVMAELRHDAGSFRTPLNQIQQVIFQEHGAGRSLSVIPLAAILGDLRIEGTDTVSYLQDIADASPSVPSVESSRKQAMELIRSWRRLQSPLPKAGDVELTCLDDVTATPIDWIWPGRLAAGKFHLLAGDAGSGKTTIALSLAATVTTGGKFPCGWQTCTGSVLMWSGEDDIADSIKPRFVACGGDAKRFHVVKGIKDENGEIIPFDPAFDVDRLIFAARAIPDLRLFIVDPVISAVSGDSHKAAETRRSLQHLVDFAIERRAAVLGITHYSKGTGGRKRAERVLGSGAFVQLSRMTMATAKSQEPGVPCRLAVIKTNFGSDDGCFEYSLERKVIDAVQGIEGQYVVWGEALEGSGQALLDELEIPDTEDATVLEAAEEWLANQMGTGPVRATYIEQAAHQAGFSKRTLYRAKKNTGVKSINAGKDGWFWSLDKIANPKQDCHSRNGGNVATLPDCQANGLASFDDEVASFPTKRDVQ